MGEVDTSTKAVRKRADELLEHSTPWLRDTAQLLEDLAAERDALQKQVEGVSTWLCDWDEDIPPGDVSALAHHVYLLMKQRGATQLDLLAERNVLQKKLQRLDDNVRDIMDCPTCEGTGSVAPWGGGDGGAPCGDCECAGWGSGRVPVSVGEQLQELAALRERETQWQENAEALLLKIPGAVRVCEGGGDEDRMKSLCVSVLKLLTGKALGAGQAAEDRSTTEG